MKRAILILAILAIAAAAGAEDLDRHDGTWWRSQPAEFKRAYLLGALDHAAPHMNPEAGLAAQWTGPDVGQLVDRVDSFYALEENRAANVQEILPLMLTWLAAGPRTSLQDALRQFARADH